MRQGGGAAISFPWVGEFTLFNRRTDSSGVSPFTTNRRVCFAADALTTQRVLNMPVFPGSLAAMDFRSPFGGM